MNIEVCVKNVLIEHLHPGLTDWIDHALFRRGIPPEEVGRFLDRMIDAMKLEMPADPMRGEMVRLGVWAYLEQQTGRRFLPEVNDE
jgi:hypothetical protein